MDTRCAVTVVDRDYMHGRQDLDQHLPEREQELDAPPWWFTPVLLLAFAIVFALFVRLVGPAFDDATSHLAPRDNPSRHVDTPQHSP